MLQPKVLDVKTRVNYCDADVRSEEDESAVSDSQYIVNQLPIINYSVKLGRYPWKIALKMSPKEIPSNGVNNPDTWGSKFPKQGG